MVNEILYINKFYLAAGYDTTTKQICLNSQLLEPEWASLHKFALAHEMGHEKIDAKNRNPVITMLYQIKYDLMDVLTRPIETDIELKKFMDSNKSDWISSLIAVVLYLIALVPLYIIVTLKFIYAHFVMFKRKHFNHVSA